MYLYLFNVKRVYMFKVSSKMQYNFGPERSGARVHAVTLDQQKVLPPRPTRLLAVEAVPLLLHSDGIIQVKLKATSLFTSLHDRDI